MGLINKMSCVFNFVHYHTVEGGHTFLRSEIFPTNHNNFSSGCFDDDVIFFSKGHHLGEGANLVWCTSVRRSFSTTQYDGIFSWTINKPCVCLGHMVHDFFCVHIVTHAKCLQIRLVFRLSHDEEISMAPSRTSVVWKRWSSFWLLMKRKEQIHETTYSWKIMKLKKQK